MLTSTAIIIPCLNERSRFPGFARALARDCPGSLIIGVDDGSTEPLRHEDAPDAILLAYPHNRGKGAAVRHGWDWVTHHRPEIDWLAFADADGAVSAAEIRRLIALAADHPSDMTAASRVAMLGRQVIRNPMRHYIGRVFATLISLGLDLTVYDTQCGFKLVRRSAYLAVREHLHVDGFCFDAELMAHLLDRGFSVREVPVDWTEQGGSKVRLMRDGWRMLREIQTIRRHRHVSAP
jgi:glycosyltransferase involved in cell wall biosynthesis